MNVALLRLPRMQRYALASIFALAETPKERRPTSDELAERTGAPRPMLTKVLRRLAVAGLVAGERGHHGGYRLIRPPGEITIGEILNAVTEDEPDHGPRECALGVRHCDPTHPCAMHHLWASATEPLALFVGTTTVAEVLADGGGARS